MPAFFSKMKGVTTSPPRPPLKAILVAWIGACIAIGAIGALERWVAGPEGLPMLIGSFGASAVLAFGAIKSPLAQPRNLVGGHVVSAFVGVACAQGFPADLTWLAAAVAVATAIALMHLTKTLHPPGGATALIAVISGEPIRQLGYLYVLVPCLAGALIMLVVALLVNNIPRESRYPQCWW